MKTETITAMIIASFIGYFAGGIFEQSAPTPISKSHTDGGAERAESHAETLEISKDKQKMGSLDSTVPSQKLPIHERLLRNKKNDKKVNLDSAFKVEGGAEKGTSNDFESLLLEPNEVKLIDQNQKQRPGKIMNSVSELEELLNEIAIEKGKRGSETQRVSLDESELQLSAETVAQIMTSPITRPGIKQQTASSGDNSTSALALAHKKRNRFNFDEGLDEKVGPSSFNGSPNWKINYPRRMEKGVIALHDVCIEPHPKPWVETKAGSCPHRPDKKYNINRRLVVYNSPSTKTIKEFSVGGHGNRKNNWEIFYQTGPPPSKFKYADYPALFVTTSCEANLHHFLVDQFSRIYGVMKDIKRLGGPNEQEFERQKVALFYRDHVHDFCRDTGCHDPTKFEELLFTLPVVSHRAYFADDAHLGTCFKDAVIGTHRAGVKDRDVSSFIVQGLSNKMKWDKQKEGGELVEEEVDRKQKHKHSSLDALTASCPSNPDKTVLILQRQNRRLLNANELAKIAISKGLHAQVVEFEDASVLQQITTVRCCKLFIAVMGAGQQWVSFMRSDSTLMSIGWANWNPLYYQKYAKESNVHFVPVVTTDVTPNYEDPTIIKFFGREKLKSASYRSELARIGNKQIAKYSDVRLSEKDMMSILRSTFKV